MSDVQSFQSILRATPVAERPQRAAELLQIYGPRPDGQRPLDLQCLTMALNRLPDATYRMKLIDKIYSANPPDPAFLQDEAERMRALADWLKHNLGYDSIRQRWNQMGEAERLSVLRQITAKHDEIAGVAEHAEIGFFRKRARNNHIELAHYQNAGRIIRINLVADGVFDNFSQCLSSIIHENTHHQQHRLVEAAVRKQSAKKLPHQSQIGWFYVALYQGCRTEDLGHDSYLRMPHEEHARANQRALSRALGPFQALAERLGWSDRPRPKPLIPGARP